MKSLTLSCFVLSLVCGCASHDGKKALQESPTSGSIDISVDESFKPIIDEEIKVFESSFPDAKVNVHYKSEADCFRDLAADSARMIIVTRELNNQEIKFYKNSFSYIPTYDLLAYDAIAVIVNNKSADTVLTMNDVRSILRDSSKKHVQVVMDGVTATSTVRYAIDSVLKGGQLGKNVFAARSSEQVINFVANNENAVGFIGVSWIADQDDPKQLNFLQKVKVAAIKCDACVPPDYVLPLQSDIVYKRYPMVRGLYYILKENFSGIGNNFVNFLIYERGQLIFRRAYLVPARMSFEIRDVQMKK
ncbi:MAG: substrate-binding domain-containing protein [Bacteroidetes bacterium]|nr:substrate-binding domain-containing protein [Bacteroidota bacterium]